MTKPHSDARAGGAAGPVSASPYLLLTLAPLFWAGNTIAGRLAVGEIEPVTLVVARFLGALVLILPFAWPHLRRDWPAIRPRLWLLLCYGGLGYAAFTLLIYLAPYFTSAVNISIEQAAIPVMVMVGNFVVFRVRSRALQIVGVALTIWGVILVATHGDPARILSLNVNVGDAMVLAACVLYSVYSLALRYRPDIHWLSFLVTTFVGAVLAALLYQATLGGGLAALARSVPETTAFGWALAGFCALFPSILSQLFYAQSVARVGPNRASLFINLIPVFGTVLAVLIVGERLEGYHFVASGFVIVGIVLAEYSAARGRRDVRGETPPT